MLSVLQILIVQNGGIGNNVSQSELLQLFTKYGVVENIVMVPKKQFCFVCFPSENTASQVLNELNGYLLRKGSDPTQDVVLYFLYTDQGRITQIGLFINHITFLADFFILFPSSQKFRPTPSPLNVSLPPPSKSSLSFFKQLLLSTILIDLGL